MVTIYTGPSDLPRERDKVYKIANAIEYRVGHFTPPKLRVLKAWAEEADAAEKAVVRIWTAWQAFTHRPDEIKRGFGVKLLANESKQRLGHFLESAENKRVWARVQEQALALGANYILLETPPSFTPAPANKERLTHFVNHWADLRDGIKLIWRPSGFWEREESVEITDELGITLAFDPLIDQKERLPSQDTAYFQMLGRHGLLDSYSDDDLEFILERCHQFDTAFVIFRTRDSLTDCLRLQQIKQHFVPMEDFDYEGEDYEDYEEDDEEYDEDEFEE
ncbi:MAG: hypothetical protein WC966_05650 [Bradymonadales bacterium]|jgi:uncharacterized protein YecE (DUF72 family)